LSAPASASFCFTTGDSPPTGKKNAGFILDEPRYEGASILVAGKNFGCGSSREHAVWALSDFGFRAVISSSFADIFANNSTKNGFLTVRLSEGEVAELMRRARDVKDYQLTIDLEHCEVRDDQGFPRSSRSMNSCAIACSTGWMISVSPCNTKRRLQPTKPCIRRPLGCSAYNRKPRVKARKDL
jgi:3-isopropylmalate dehydratase small subunit